MGCKNQHIFKPPYREDAFMSNMPALFKKLKTTLSIPKRYYNRPPITFKCDSSKIVHLGEYCFKKWDYHSEDLNSYATI